jgi:hypothetical protein
MTTIFQPKAKWREHPEWPSMYPGLRWYTWGDCKVLVGLEPAGWHMSISHPTRNPTWEEIKQARYDHCPHDVTMAMILPPTDEYVNLHNFCFHLHQIPNE